MGLEASRAGTGLDGGMLDVVRMEDLVVPQKRGISGAQRSSLDGAQKEDCSTRWVGGA